MADVIAKFGPAFLTQHGAKVPGHWRKAMRAIERCRTPALGGHVLECTCCRMQRYAYHSCRHRACPGCLREEMEEWCKAREEDLLPVPYLHIVFGLPNKLQAIIRAHQAVTYPLLQEATAKALAKLAANPHYLGGTIGVMTTLHTAANTLAYHPHVHCVMPAGGVDMNGQWRPFPNPLFAPKDVLANAFRDALIPLLKANLKDVEIPESGFCAGWNAYVEQPKHGIEKVLRYLARSLFRGPMHKHRILAITEEHVVFQYTRRDGTLRSMRLEGSVFLHRFLQHVWPDRIHKVRYFGLLSRKSRAQLQAIKKQLLAELGTATPPPQPTVEPNAETVPAPIPQWQKCPHCSSKCVVVAVFGPGEIPPPLKNPTPLAQPPPTTAQAPW